MKTPKTPSGPLFNESSCAGYFAYTQKPLPRSQVLTILRTALTLGDVRFARQAALNWLTAYPGDLPVRLLHATTFMQPVSSAGINANTQAVTILESISQADPEFVPALEALQVALRKTGQERLADIAAMVCALGGAYNLSAPLPEWVSQVNEARQALVFSDSYHVDIAERLSNQALLGEDTPILAAITHLRVVQRKGMPSAVVSSLAENYLRRWPDCLQFCLILANALIENGDADRGVDLLHQAAARDVTGQVPLRLWGENHPYKSLWPLEMAAPVLEELPVPASVAAALGWNRLTAGSPADTLSSEADVVYELIEEDIPALEDSEDEAALVAFLAELFPEKPRAEEESTPPEPEVENQPDLIAKPARQRRSSPVRENTMPPVNAQPMPEALRPVQVELERVAAHIKKPQLARTDGRFPVYVVFTTRRGLEEQYGQEGAASVEEAMLKLVEAVNSRKYWGAMLYYADDPSESPGALSELLKLKPARPSDAWSLKLALADLDAGLAKQGEMIGALLIVGGPEVVPFHRLPNPVDDDDLEVASDNPYTTRDENYFVPEWPTGRLPGGTGKDPGILVESLLSFADQHLELAKGIPWYRVGFDKLINRFLPSVSRVKPSLGYSAAIWRRASLSVYRPIGESRSMLVSPPTQARTYPEQGDGLSSSEENSVSGRQNGNRTYLPFYLHPVRLGYFNLHGLSDSAEWYGQCDPFENNGGPDYPVALRPSDIEGGRRNGRRANKGRGNGGRKDIGRNETSLIPQVIFSEACYGAHIEGRKVDDSVALTFISKGSQAVVGSTCIAYGAINTPLIGADLLGYSFWHYLAEGLPAGEALRRAKIRLAREMHRRQGYLDGEDQKTLISFVLYGDPLAQPQGNGRGAKTVLRPQTPPSTVKVVCDRCEDEATPRSIPPEVLIYVRNIVEQYLPGMEGAQLSITREHIECQSATHSCPSAQMGAKSQPGYAPERQVVTLAKQVRRSAYTHKHYARLTLDSQGKLVKLVVSR